jgi:hypothetical protein
VTRRLFWLACVPVLAFLASCADPSGPDTHEHPQRLLIAGTEAGAIVVDLDWRGIVRSSGPRFVSHGPSALNGRGDLITVGRLQGNALVMAGLDVESGLELWRTAIHTGTVPVVVDGVQLGADMIAANPTRTEVFLYPAIQDGVAGIVGYDYDRQRVTRFLAPTGPRLRALVATPASSEHPTGCVILALDGPAGNSSRAFLHRTCGSNYAERDSVDLGAANHVVLQMETSGNGADILVMTDTELLRFDASTLVLERRATRPLPAPFSLSLATGRVIVSDVGNSVVASTGLIYVLDADLELSALIDLRVLPFNQRPLGILGAEESRDGRWLYVIGGVPRSGPAYGPEKTHVIVIEKATGSLKDAVMLETYGGGRPILIP